MRLLHLPALKNVKQTIRRHPNLLAFCSKHSFNDPGAKLWSEHRLLGEMTDIDAKLLKTARTELLQILSSSVSAVMPDVAVAEKIKLVDGELLVDSTAHPLADNVYLVGFGKAVAGMARALEELLGERLRRGVVSVPRACLKAPARPTAEELRGLGERAELGLQGLQMLMRSRVIEYREGAADNQPDEAAQTATEAIVELVRDLGEDDSLLVLVSGGGSALLFQPKPPLTAEAKRGLCRRLQNAGASITELNRVRQRLSMVKAGGLARIAYPARVLTLVLSDIVGDPLESIASGPTCLVDQEILQKEAVDILEKYGLFETVDDEVKQILLDNVKEASDKDMVDEGKFKHVENIIIGNNTNALQAAKKAANQLDLESIILTSTVEGDVESVSSSYAILTKLVCLALHGKFSTEEDFFTEVFKESVEALKINEEKFEEMFVTLSNLRRNKGVLLLAGGEPTVVVKGNGKGGRNQELALRFSLDWLGEISRHPELAKYFVVFLSAGSDGQDGPTDAAGAFGYPGFRPKMIKIHQNLVEKKKMTVHPEQLKDLENKLKQVDEMLPENVLKRNDSYNFYSKFENGTNLVKTGLTGTNVMDLHFIYIKERDCNCDIQSLKNSNKEIVDDYGFLFDESSKGTL